MKFLLKRIIGWTVYLTVTILFFSIPIILRNDNSTDPLSTSGQYSAREVGLFLEFAGGSGERKVEGDSTAVRMIAETDTSRKIVYLYVNGDKQDMAFVSDSMGIEFPRVYLKEGKNEIIAVLRSVSGDTLAVRKLSIVSLKKL